MASPTVSAVLDKATYVPGAPIVLTVSYNDPDTATSVITVTGTDAAGHPATVTVTLAVVDPVTVTVTDTKGHVWTKGADNGAQVTFTTTA
jgi:hypothetical protein